MQPGLEATLRAVVSFLTENGYRYAVVGGIALSQWGVVRATYDADIKVLVPDADYAGVRAALRAAFPQPARPHTPPNPLIVDAMVGDVVVDFLLALPGYEELLIQRAVERDMGGWMAWICSSEDLIIQKVVAGREKDWMDVESLLVERQGLLDCIYVRDWLAQFADVLEAPGLLTRFEHLLAKSAPKDDAPVAGRGGL